MSGFPTPERLMSLAWGMVWARVVVSCPAPHSLPMYKGKMRQWVSNSFGSKYRCYLAYLEENTDFRMPLA